MQQQVLNATIITNRNENVGRAILGYLQERKLAKAVEVTTISTVRNPLTRTKTTKINYKFKK